MKHFELSRGNYFALINRSHEVHLPNYTFPIKIMEVKTFHAMYLTGNENPSQAVFLECSISDIAGIPITEKLIISLGFSSHELVHKDGSITPLVYSKDKSIRLQWYSEKSLNEKDTGSLMVLFEKNDSIFGYRYMKCIKYVHELQNFYRFFKGDEIILNLK